MSMPSPKYTPEFKRHAVELYRSTEGATYAQIGRELGVDAGSVSAWVRKADAAGAAPADDPFQMAEDLWICYIFLNSFQRDSPASLNSTGLMQPKVEWILVLL